MEHLHLRHLSTGEHTHWPSDRNKLPDLLGFCVIKGISPNSAAATSCLELSSDHSPVIVVLNTFPAFRDTTPLKKSKHKLGFLSPSCHRTPNIPLKITEDIEEAVKLFDSSIQWAGWTATPNSTAASPHSQLPYIHQTNI
jgi:hypothetical protein